MVLLHHFHAGLCFEHGLEHVHFHAKVAEDNPLVLCGRVTDNVPECVELCTAAFPIWPGIEGLECMLPCGNVDLRMQGELAEAHEEFEAFNGCAAAVCLECLPAAADYASHAEIEVLFLFCVEGNADCHIFGLGRGVLD